MPLPEEILEQIPEQYRNNETLNRFNNVGDLAKSYVEARGSLGNSIRIPGKDAGQEDRQKFLDSLLSNAPDVMLKPNFDDEEQATEFWRTLGMPDDPSGYETPEDLPMPLGDDTVEGLRKAFREMNGTKTQFKKFIKSMTGAMAEANQAKQQEFEQQTGALKQEWGMTFEDRVNAAKQIHETTGVYPDRAFGDLSPKEIKALYKLHEAMTGKGPQAPSQDGQFTQKDTPAEAQEKYAEIMRRVHAPDSDLSREEKLRLVNKGMKILVDAGVARDSLDELRAGARVGMRR